MNYAANRIRSLLIEKKPDQAEFVNSLSDVQILDAWVATLNKQAKQAEVDKRAVVDGKCRHGVAYRHCRVCVKL